MNRSSCRSGHASVPASPLARATFRCVRGLCCSTVGGFSAIGWVDILNHGYASKYEDIHHCHFWILLEIDFRDFGNCNYSWQSQVTSVPKCWPRTDELQGQSGRLTCKKANDSACFFSPLLLCDILQMVCLSAVNHQQGSRSGQNCIFIYT